MDVVSLLIQLVGGAVGGNVAAAAGKQLSLGTLGNTIAGAVGGVGGGQILAMLVPALGAAASGGNMDIGALVGQFAGGGVGGAILTAIVGLIKAKMGTKPA